MINLTPITHIMPLCGRLRSPLVRSDRKLYDSYMTEMAVSEARDHLAELIDTTRRSGDPVFVTRRGRRVAVILDPDVYEQLLEDAEETLDLAELQAAREDDDYIPFNDAGDIGSHVVAYGLRLFYTT